MSEQTTTVKPTVVRVEDHEGDGRCGHCGRESLRWVVVLSDGSQVGLECAKKMLGFRGAAKDYEWMSLYEAVAEHRQFDHYHQTWSVHVLWQRKGGSQTRATRNGALTTVGGARRDWEQEGWL